MVQHAWLYVVLLTLSRYGVKALFLPTKGRSQAAAGGRHTQGAGVTGGSSPPHHTAVQPQGQGTHQLWTIL